MQPFAHHVDLEDDDTHSTMVPFVRHTFLHVGPAPGAELTKCNGARRCVSLSPRGNRDSFAMHFHALLYKPTPVQLTPPVRPEPETRLRWSDEAEAETTDVAPNNVKLRHLRNGRRGNAVVKLAEPEKPGQHQCNPRAEDDQSTEAGSTADVGELSCSSRESSYSSAVQGDQEDDPDEEELLRRVPSDENGNPMSIGSIAHEAGTCKPCVFAYNTKKACANGVRCSFCHFVHPPKVRVRLCKKKRMDIKRAQEAEAHDDARWR